MKGYVVRFGVAALVACALAKPAAAQLAATPVYFSPKQPVGLTLAMDFGSTLNLKQNDVQYAVGGQAVKPNNLGARAALGLPFITLGVGAGSYNPDISGADKSLQFMGSAALKLFSPPLVPIGLSLQAGAGYLKQGSGVSAVKTISVPIGVGVAIKPPTPGMSVEVWGAPRLQLTAVSMVGSSRAQAGIGASGGVNLGMPMGLGLHVAVDYTKLSAKASAGTGSLALPETQQLVLGVGLHYTFTIPGLPMVPVI